MYLYIHIHICAYVCLCVCVWFVEESAKARRGYHQIPWDWSYSEHLDMCTRDQT